MNSWMTAVALAGEVRRLRREVVKPARRPRRVRIAEEGGQRQAAETAAEAGQDFAAR